ncbi:hypothetical protein PIIN_07788 [Serendipita indica DSM 11827]|uniref:F-box domain-containing protein n=1 Tax=Serendipita indica (strain DSM 11827) TaxID=1109443 RepID=G4TR91_SERID|nr:hypothetical protein PIIN_07788 [Serendipita indica DSM 11827]
MRNYSISKAWSRISANTQNSEFIISKRRSKNAMDASIFVLPNEDLIHIFRYVVASDSRRRLPTSHRRANEILAHVCTRFRAIILSTSDLWSTIDVPLYWAPDILQDYLATSFKRAKNTPLRVVVYEGSRAVLPKVDIANLFCRELQRGTEATTNVSIKSVAFYLVHQEMSHIPTHFINILPSSPHALLIHRVTIDQSIGKFKLELPSTLRYVPLGGCPRVATIESIELVDVTLRDVPEGLMAWRSVQFRSHPISSSRPGSPTAPTPSAPIRIPADLVFERCPNLKTLIVDGSFSGSPNGATVPTPPLPPLREFYIRDLAQLRSFGYDGHFPMLHKFGTATSDERLVCRFLRRHPTIVDLTLEGIYISESIALSCPQIRRLSIPARLDILVRSARRNSASEDSEGQDEPYDCYLRDGTTNHVNSMQAIGYNPLLFTRKERATYNPLFIPDNRGLLLTSLEHLQIDCAEFPLSMEQFSELIETRVLRAAEHGYPRSLSQISVCTSSLSRMSKSLVRREQERAWTKSPYLESAQLRWKENTCHVRWK